MQSTTQRRILNEFKKIAREEESLRESGLVFNLNSDDLSIFTVDIIPTSGKSKAECKFKEDYLSGKRFTLEVRVPNDYPNSPPFVRSLNYITRYMSNRGGICHQSLSTGSWRSSVSFIALIQGLRLAFFERSADMHDLGTIYSYEQTKSDYNQYMNQHLWNKKE